MCGWIFSFLLSYVIRGATCTTSGTPKDRTSHSPFSSDQQDIGLDLVPGYSIGRLAEGQFEYPRLNGWMTPNQAANLCEKDLMCAGFTYKGSLIMDKEYDIYFFQLTVNVENDRDSWKWIYFQVKRQFSTFPGVFTNKHKIRNKIKKTKNIEMWVDLENAEKKCLSLGDKCIGFVQTKNKTTATLIDYIDMDTFVAIPNKFTKVKLADMNSETYIDGQSSWDKIKRCCPKSEKVNTEKLIKEIRDTVERISCDISKEDFLEKYVKKRQVVVLVNCSSEWYAQKHWTINNLLKEGDGRALWTADIEMENEGLFKKYKDADHVPGNILQQIMDHNGTVKVFHPIGKRKHTALRKELGRAAETDKMHLLKEYQAPKPFPKDYFESSGILTDYQWVIFSQRDTGTELHTDPEYTDPWNTLISGHKWWTFLPPDVLPDQFLCDEKCSKGGTDDEISIYAWYTHVLPQLQKRTFYGGKVENILQKPGETLFIPGHLAHSVMNLDDTVSVTENYNLVSNLVDYVHGVMVGEDLLDGDDQKDVEKMWRAMYNKHMDRDGRNVMRQMRNQVELMARKNPEACDQNDEDEEEEDDSDEEDDSEEDFR